jgi:TolB-like protein
VLLIVAAVVITAGFFAIDRFVMSKRGADSARLSAPIVATVAPAPSTLAEKSIAVLPFVDMSEKKDQEYFGDGMAEEILNLLVKIPGLKVIGRTSSFQFKGKTNDLRKTGAALGAAYIVEGSVRRFGDQVRVTAQLIDTRDGAHRWSDTYDPLLKKLAGDPRYEAFLRKMNLPH